MAILRTLSDFQSYAPITNLLKCDLSHYRAAVVKISTDTARRAVPLRATAEFLVCLVSLRLNPGPLELTELPEARYIARPLG